MIADVIFFCITSGTFFKNKKKNVHDDRSVLLLLNIWIGIYIKFADKEWRLIISAIAILTYSIVRYIKHCEKPVFILTLFYELRSFSLLVANECISICE